MLYHLTTAEAWRDAVRSGAYSPESLTAEGYIHLSDLGQVSVTATRFFAGRADLLLLEIDEKLLACEVRWEDLYGHGAFPHLDGELNLDAVVRAEPYLQEI